MTTEQYRSWIRRRHTARRIASGAEYVFRKLPFLPAFAIQHAFQKRLFRRQKLCHHAGIAITDGWVGGTASVEMAEFTAMVQDALDLIARVDPRRLRRIQQHVHYIVHGPTLTTGLYLHGSRACVVNFSAFRVPPPGEEHRDWYVAYLAATLIHEATHGRLCAAHFPCTPGSWERIERLCWREERRFAARLSVDTRYDWIKMVGDFDPEWYRQYRSMRLHEVWRRARTCTDSHNLRR